MLKQKLHLAPNITISHHNKNPLQPLLQSSSPLQSKKNTFQTNTGYLYPQKKNETISCLLPNSPPFPPLHQYNFPITTKASAATSAKRPPRHHQCPLKSWTHFSLYPPDKSDTCRHISQLNSSTDGITIFAPTDTTFSNLRLGALGSLSDRAKVELVQFHVLPKYLSLADFQTLSNPVRTLAGSDLRFPLTITTSDNSVHISSGVTKTSISGTVYNDKQQVAIYQVDKVILPMNVFPPAPAPAPEKANMSSPDATIVKNGAGGRGSLLSAENGMFLVLSVVAATCCAMQRGSPDQV